MMPKLTQEDFEMGYSDITAHSEYDGEYPKIVRWVSQRPISAGALQVSAAVLQRKQAEDQPWTFSPSIKPSDATVSTRDGAGYETDQYAGYSKTLPTYRTFDDAIWAIENAIQELLDA